MNIISLHLDWPFCMRSCLRRHRLCAGKWNILPLFIYKYFLYQLIRRYRPAYKAFRSDSSFNFMVFFFIFFFQMIILVVQTVGIYGSGYCGFITALSQFDGTPSGIIMGLFLLCIAISFAICTAGNVMLLTKVINRLFILFLNSKKKIHFAKQIHSIYRHSDTVSMNKAQAEFTNEFMHNQHVQRAAANATSAAVSSQFGGGTSANRYWSTDNVVNFT